MKTRLEQDIKSLANPDRREVLMRFFKTGKGQYGEGDRFLGVKVPQVRALVRRHAESCSFADIERFPEPLRKSYLIRPATDGATS
ncbi:MAG: DNA alkylation repair protein [Kiritimatiellae bacterium]|nr:DNA alkylation repair protein [Kiritimatiellia bacterium]